jgi:prepilin-type N-terminal cleavage/methylation domain-containing protein
MKLIKKTAGFTLVEIMIVVAIIGLLAAIAVPNFVQARNTTRKNTCINNLRLIDAAKEQYALENNKDSATTPDDADLEPYMKGDEMPTCPSEGAYTVDAIGSPPTCDVDGHALP